MNFLFTEEHWNNTTNSLHKKTFNIDNKKKCFLKTKSEYWNDFSLEPRDTEDWSSESIFKYI